ncbi:MAG: hypothetical protein JWO71_4271 [Candidatus Acidoferrum typicum]|nr:hypothetical protein [Candidatus Acidoferrum typicum]
MVSRKLVVAVMVAICSVKLIGCHGEAAPSKRWPPTQAAPNPVVRSKDPSQTSLAGNHARPLHSGTPHRDAPREAFRSTYNNPEQGISFRYPRNYSLEDGDVQEHSFFLKRQEDLDLERPGARLVATILIPEDGYPNTTFEHGSLQLVIDEAASEKSCRDSISPGSSAGSNVNRSGTTTVQGTALFWSEQESEAGGTKILERAYAGYSQGTCYEFLLTLAVEETPDPDGFGKAADTTKIMKQLEKIVLSVQIFNKGVPPPVETSEETADRL